MIDPVVRSAVEHDAARLDELETEARAALVDARGGARWLDEHPSIFWPDAIATRAVMVGEIDGLVIGYLVLDVGGAVAHVDQVYITPAARELGFGDELLALATAQARARGAAVIEGHALPGDRDTKNLYERAGITARLITVSRRLN